MTSDGVSSNVTGVPIVAAIQMLLSLAAKVDVATALRTDVQFNSLGLLFGRRGRRSLTCIKLLPYGS